MLQVLFHKINILATLEENMFENTVGEGENATNQYFLPFPNIFYHSKRQKSSRGQLLELALCNCLQVGPI